MLLYEMIVNIIFVYYLYSTLYVCTSVSVSTMRNFDFILYLLSSFPTKKHHILAMVGISALQLCQVIYSLAGLPIHRVNFIAMELG